MAQVQEKSFLRQSSILVLFFSLVFVIIAFFHFGFLTQIGFMSDDYSLLASSERGGDLWHFHHSPLLELFWKWTALKGIDALYWRFLILGCHVLNVFLLYLVSSRQLKLTQFQSLFLCACFAMSPAGMEALAWTCSAGYVMTFLWIVLAWYLFFKWHETVSEKFLFLKGIVLALLQVMAFLTWDWGILLFPILAIFAFTKANYFRSTTLLVPSLACWVLVTGWRLVSNHGLIWQENSSLMKVQFLLGAAFLGFFPNVSKDLYVEWYGLLIISLFVCSIFYIALTDRYALASLICFMASVFPWVNGGNPSGRYFYISMPFIYMIIAIGLGKIKKQSHTYVVGALLLILQLYFTYERDQLWKNAFEQSISVIEAAKVLQQKVGEPIIIVNLPNAYGPEKMPMRPQMWFSGFFDLFPDIKVVKTNSCPFVWQKGSHATLTRSEIAKLYSGTLLYEALYRHQNDWHEFELMPFKP